MSDDEPDVFSECVHIEDAEPVRQGDVIQFIDASADLWRAFGVVVTADCDLAQSKHAGLLTYIPLLPLDDYLRLFYLPRRVERVRDNLRTEAFALVRRMQRMYRTDLTTELSAEAITTWVLSAASDDIVNSLSVPAGPERERVVSSMNLLRRTEEALSSESFDAQLAALAAVRGRAGSKGGDRTAIEVLWADVLSYIRSLPGDAFFVSSLADDSANGYIAYLRVIRDIRENEIALRYADLRGMSIRAKRIARLSAPFIYSLTQQLAAVFSAIGLPREYENQRDTLVQAKVNTPPLSRLMKANP